MDGPAKGVQKHAVLWTAMPGHDALRTLAPTKKSLCFQRFLKSNSQIAGHFASKSPLPGIGLLLSY
jgi:hypothetical protein